MATGIKVQEFQVYNTSRSRLMFPGLIIPGNEMRTTTDSTLFSIPVVAEALENGTIQVVPDPRLYFSSESGTIDQASAGGPGGGSGTGDLNYKHPQLIPLAVWTITHNLGKQPSVTVVDSSGAVCEGQIDYPSINQVVITFSAAFSGTAYLN